MEKHEYRAERDEDDELKELKDADGRQDRSIGAKLKRASQRIVEYWKRDHRGRKTGTLPTLLELEVGRIEEQRELEADLAQRFDEPGIGERKSGHLPLAYLVYPLVGILVVAIPVGYFLKKASERSPAQAITEPARPFEANPEIDESGVGDRTPTEVAESFLAATTMEERLRLAWKPELVGSHLEAYPADVMALPIGMEVLREIGPAVSGGEIRFHRFGLRLESGGVRFLCVVETAGGLRVDYDTLARFGSATWDELLAGTPAEEVRLMAKESFYFNHDFEDDKAWVAFELTNPDWPDSATGYAPTGSATAAILSDIVANRAQRVTLHLRAEGESHRHRQFVIEKIIASGWVLPDVDLEERWIRRKVEDPLRD